MFEKSEKQSIPLNPAGKVPPHNVEAEQSILGGLLIDPEAWDQIADVLDQKDFYKPAHQNIFGAIRDLQRKGQVADLITVTNSLQASGNIAACGGPEYLVEILNRTISSANIGAYAKIVREKSLLRQMIHTSSGLIEKAFDGSFTDVDSFLDEAEGAFYKLSDNTKTEGLTSSQDLVRSSIIKIEELYRNRSDISGIPSGFAGLDRMTSGFNPGDLVIVAARPSMGKTAFSLNLAQHMALKEKKTVAYFSLEMGKEAVMMRMLASEAKIDMKDVRTGRVTDDAWPRLIHTAGQLSEAPFFIDDTPGLSPLELRARARRLKARQGLDIIFVDYLQIMSLKQKIESREKEVSEISRTLKAIAKELQVPVIALAQLSRAVEGRTDRRPILSDLRESGSIEQDADVIMMLYREDYYEKDDPEKSGHAEVIIGKQRNGPTGNVKMRWEARFGKFKDADQEPSHPLPPPPPQAGPGGAIPFGKPRNFAPGANA